MYDRLETVPNPMIERIDPTEEIVIGEIGDGDDPDDLPTEEDAGDPIGARLAREVDALDADVVSTTLPIAARDAFEIFCDLEAIPRWVSVVKSVKVVAYNAGGRARRAAFLARLTRASIGYTLHYRYDEASRIVTWGTAAGASTQVAGRAQFMALGERATLMQYQLHLELPENALPPWEDPFYSGHAASVVLNDFREHVARMLRS